MKKNYKYNSFFDGGIQENTDRIGTIVFESEDEGGADLKWYQDSKDGLRLAVIIMLGETTF